MWAFERSFAVSSLLWGSHKVFVQRPTGIIRGWSIFFGSIPPPAPPSALCPNPLPGWCVSKHRVKVSCRQMPGTSLLQLVSFGIKKREKENDQRVSPGSWNWHTVHNLTDIKFRFVSLCHTHTLCLEKDQVKQPTCMSECCYSPSVWDAGEVSELPKHFPYKFDSNCVAWSLQKINMKTSWIGSLLDLSFQTMLQV